MVSLAAGLVHAQTLDFSTSTHASPTGARDAVAADLNRDGWPDLATANTGRNTIAILLNRGDGTGFGPAQEIAVGAGPFDIDAGDLNGDAIPDLVVTTPDAHAIEVLFFGTDGRPASRTTVAAASDARGATLADVTRDGSLDLVYTDYARNRVVLMPGNGAGGFLAPAEWVVGARPQGVAAADFNHDGLVDLAVASTGATALDVLYGGPAGTFTRRTVSAGRTLNVVAVADMNADGWLDIAAAATSTNVVVLFKGSATGFSAAGGRAVGASPRGLASGDFNQDGRPDLAVSNSGSGTVTVLLGRRDGSVLPDDWGDLPSGAGARGVASADFNHDGRLDVAVGAQSAARVSLHENVTQFVAPALSFRRQATGLYYAPSAVADFNENGKPDLVTTFTLLLDNGTQVPLPQDIDSNTLTVDAADYTRDGHQDVLTFKVAADSAGRPYSLLQLFVGDGKGGLAAPRNIEGLPRGVDGFRTADFDKDGHLDVLAFTSGEAVLVRRVGSTPSVQPVIATRSIFDLQIGDVNLDGSVDAVVATYYDGFLVFAGSGDGSFDEVITVGGDTMPNFALGDLNHDGRPDIVGDGGSVILVTLSRGSGWAPQASYDSWVPFDTGTGTLLGDFDNDGNLDVLTWGGAMLFGDGQGGLGGMRRFAVRPYYGLAHDWNRDGLLDIVGGFEILLNERRAVNRAPVADAGPDRTYEFRDHLWDDEWCERTTPSFDPDAHLVLQEWRDDTGTRFTCIMPPHAPGTYTFTLTARDDLGGSSTDTMRVTILPEPEIVLHAGHAWDIHGTGWQRVNDPDAASQTRLYSPNLGAPKTPAPAASPASYVDFLFAADPTQTYKLWVRLKADGNSWGNDSVWLQFDGAVASDGGTYALGTASGLPVNLEECSGCGISGWGWEDDGWGAPNRNGVTLRFPQGGFRRIRVQVREDGVSIDQIVLSAVKYRTTRPGTAKNDATILPYTQ
jgi:hypothetical protein